MTGRRRIAVDLDGVLAEYHGWTSKGFQKIGDPLPGAREFLQKLRGRDLEIVIYTTRCSKEVNPEYSVEWLKDKVIDWLELNGMEWDEVYAGQGKPLASAYVDDRAVLCRPQKCSESFDCAIEKIDKMLA